MGADISLRSVVTEDVHKAVMHEVMAEAEGKAADRALTGPELILVLNECYERLAETGGYFRDPYNESGLLPALGMDWGRDVGPMLNENGELPIDGAHHLLAEITARPITPAMVDDVFAGRGTPHPMVAFMRQVHEELGADVRIQGFVEEMRPGEPPRVGVLDEVGFAQHLTKRRARLMALLRRSIELEEPLECSL
jgi:hypothetical protein